MSKGNRARLDGHRERTGTHLGIELFTLLLWRSVVCSDSSFFFEYLLIDWLYCRGHPSCSFPRCMSSLPCCTFSLPYLLIRRNFHSWLEFTCQTLNQTKLFSFYAPSDISDIVLYILLVDTSLRLNESELQDIIFSIRVYIHVRGTRQQSILSKCTTAQTHPTATVIL